MGLGGLFAGVTGPLLSAFVPLLVREVLGERRTAIGGVMAIDNVLWNGRVLDPKEPDDHAIAAFNDHVRADMRVTCVMLSVRDGITLVRWRAA